MKRGHKQKIDFAKSMIFSAIQQSEQRWMIVVRGDHEKWTFFEEVILANRCLQRLACGQDNFGLTIESDRHVALMQS